MPWSKEMQSRDFPDEHLKAIGMVAVEWSYLEHWVMVVAIDLAGLKDPYGRILLTHMSMDNQLHAISASAKVRLEAEDEMDEDEHAELEDLMQGINPLRLKRNEIVHAFWFTFQQDGKFQIYKANARKEFKVTMPTWAPAAMVEVAEEISQLASAWQMFAMERGAELAD